MALVCRRSLFAIGMLAVVVSRGRNAESLEIVGSCLAGNKLGG
jgi:hypothetical protein